MCETTAPHFCGFEVMALAKLHQSTDHGKPRVHWRLWFALLGVITFFVVACYGVTFSMGSVFNDDLTMHYVNSGHGVGALDMLLSPLKQPWVRLTYLTDLANYTNREARTVSFGWFHVDDVYWHWVAAAALFCLTFRLFWRWKNDGAVSFDPYRMAFACALLFACHPMNAEAATYVSARYGVLAGCNFLVALNWFLLGVLSGPGAARVWGYLLFVVFGWMCLCSGTVGLALVPASLVVFFLSKPAAKDWKEWALDHPIVLGLLVAFAVCLPLTFFLGFAPAATPDSYGTAAVSNAIYYATQAKAFLTYYLRCAVVPLGLTVDPPYARATGLFDPLAIAGLLAFVSLVAAIYMARRNKALVLGLCLVVLGFLPHAAIAQRELVADPVFYISIAGFSIIFVTLIQRLLLTQWKEVGIPLAIVLCSLTVVHALDFRNDQTLILEILKINKNSVVGYMLSASGAFSNRDYEKAVSDSDKALSIQPVLPVALLIKGSALLKLKQYAQAQEPLRKAYDLAQQQHLDIMPQAIYSLAEDTLLQGKLEEFNKFARAAIFADSKNPRIFYLLGLAQCRKSDYQTAMGYLKKACEAGVIEAFPVYADALLHQHRFNDAFSISEMASVAPPSAESMATYANAAIAVHKLQIADSVLTQACEQYKDNAKLIALRSLLHQERGEASAAEDDKKKALQLDPKVFDNLVIRQSSDEDKSVERQT
jgi:tetratricopeptide (TPR) repeat protein